MLRQAQRRTRRWADRADLRAGSASRLGWPDASFDAVIAVSSIQLW